MLSGKTTKILFVERDDNIIMLSEIDTGLTSAKRTYINMYTLNESKWDFVRQLSIYYKRKKNQPSILSVIGFALFYDIEVTDIIQHGVYEKILKKYISTLLSGTYEDNTWLVRNKKNPIKRKSRKSQK